MVSNTGWFHIVQRLAFETDAWKEQGPVSPLPTPRMTSSFSPGASMVNPEQSLFHSTERGRPPLLLRQLYLFAIANKAPALGTNF